MNRTDAIEVVRLFLSNPGKGFTDDGELPSEIMAEQVLDRMAIAACEVGYQVEFSLTELIIWAAHDVYREMTGVVI